MKRREFLKKTVGVAATAALVAVGLKPSDPFPATKYFQLWINAETKGKGGRMPKLIEAGRDLLDQYVRECSVQKTYPVPSDGSFKALTFKGPRVQYGGPGWYLKRLA